MSIFPSNPDIGDEYSGYSWDGEAWRVIGIDFNINYATAADLAAHEIDYTNIHNIVDTTTLATKSYVDTAESDAILSANSYSDSLASNYDLAGSASTAQTNAESYADTAIASLVDTAPSTLDTLNELAAALGDDANFSTTVAASLGNKADIDSPTFTGISSGVSPTAAGSVGFRNITMSTSSPSGGNDGDVWLVYV